METIGKLILFHPSPPASFFRYVGIFFPSGYIHTNYSYPSGHVFRIIFLAVLLVAFFNLKTKPIALKWTLAIFILAMIVSRVYLGEHWLSDVVGGTLLGLSMGVLAFSIKIKLWQD